MKSYNFNNTKWLLTDQPDSVPNYSLHTSSVLFSDVWDTNYYGLFWSNDDVYYYTSGSSTTSVLAYGGQGWEQGLDEITFVKNANSIIDAGTSSSSYARTDLYNNFTAWGSYMRRNEIWQGGNAIGALDFDGNHTIETLNCAGKIIQNNIVVNNFDYPYATFSYRYPSITITMSSNSYDNSVEVYGGTGTRTTAYKLLNQEFLGILHKGETKVFKSDGDYIQIVGITEPWQTSSKSSNVIVVGSGFQAVTYRLTDTSPATISGISYCLTGDTLITMADRTTKRLDMIDIGDEILSFDWETMQLIPNKVIYTDKDRHQAWIEYDIWTFDDGSKIKTVHRHEFYNVEAKCFKYMDEWTLGDHTYKIDGTKPKLINHEKVREGVSHYKISGEHGTNYFANGLLTGDRYCPKNIEL